MGVRGFTGLGGEFIAELSNTNASVPATAAGCLVSELSTEGSSRSSYDPRSRPSIRINIRFPGKPLFFRRPNAPALPDNVANEVF